MVGPTVICHRHLEPGETPNMHNRSPAWHQLARVDTNVVVVVGAYVVRVYLLSRVYLWLDYLCRVSDISIPNP